MIAADITSTVQLAPRYAHAVQRCSYDCISDHYRAKFRGMHEETALLCYSCSVTRSIVVIMHIVEVTLKSRFELPLIDVEVFTRTSPRLVDAGFWYQSQVAVDSESSSV